METIESKIINDFLGTLEKVPLTDTPLFRLVWSDDQRELRTSTRNLYLGATFITTIKSTEKSPKYPWINAKWVFEMWFGPEVAMTEELPDSRNGSYEPLYVFEKPLNKRVIEFLVAQIRKPKSSSALIQSTIAEEMRFKEEELDKIEMEYLDTSTDIQSNLHFGEGIIVPATYDVESPNLRRFKK